MIKKNGSSVDEILCEIQDFIGKANVTDAVKISLNVALAETVIKEIFTVKKMTERIISECEGLSEEETAIKINELAA